MSRSTTFVTCAQTSLTWSKNEVFQKNVGSAGAFQKVEVRIKKLEFKTSNLELRRTLIVHNVPG